MSGNIKNGAFGIKTSRFQSAYHAAPPVRHLTNTERPMHEPDAPVSPFKKMGGSKLAASHIIDGDRTQVLDTAGPVKQNDGNATLPEALQVTGITLHRRNQDALCALLLEDVQIMIFFIDRIIRIAQDNYVSGLVSQVLNTTRNLCEKGVSHIE